MRVLEALCTHLKENQDDVMGFRYELKGRVFKVVPELGDVWIQEVTCEIPANILYHSPFGDVIRSFDELKTYMEVHYDQDVTDFDFKRARKKGQNSPLKEAVNNGVLGEVSNHQKPFKPPRGKSKDVFLDSESRILAKTETLGSGGESVKVEPETEAVLIRKRYLQKIAKDNEERRSRHPQVSRVCEIVKACGHLVLLGSVKLLGELPNRTALGDDGGGDEDLKHHILSFNKEQLSFAHIQRCDVGAVFVSLLAHIYGSEY